MAKADKGRNERICGTMQVHERLLRTDPGYLEARVRSENAAFEARTMRAMTARAGITVIPTVVHVVRNTNAQNISTPDQEPDRRSQPRFPRPRTRTSRACRPRSGRGSWPTPDRVRTRDDRSERQPHHGIVYAPTTGERRSSDDDSVKSAATGGADPWAARRVSQHLGLHARQRPAGLRAVPGRAGRHRWRGVPAHGVRHDRHRRRSVRSRPDDDPRDRPLAQPPPHLGRRRNRTAPG